MLPIDLSYHLNPILANFVDENEVQKDKINHPRENERHSIGLLDVCPNVPKGFPECHKEYFGRPRHLGRQRRTRRQLVTLTQTLARFLV